MSPALSLPTLDAPETAPDSAADWVLVCTADARGVVRFEGVPGIDRPGVSVFFDGWLFDRSAWTRELNLTGAASDGEIVAEAYGRYGEAALRRLRGSFVAAVSDARSGCTRVVRDPIGSQPLFYATAGSTVRFASSIAPLLEGPGASRALNRLALADQLGNRWPERHETFFASVRRVPPGWWAEVSPEGVRSRRYWDPLDGGPEWLTAAEADAFDEHLTRAVRRCLEIGRCGIFLSGGFDSVSVAAVAADEARRAGHETPRGLSLGFPAPECDERQVQTSVSRALDLPLDLVDFHQAAGPRGLFAAGLELNRGLTAPLLNAWMPAYRTLARRASAGGVRVILTGSGGDEWLGVTPYLAADLIRRGQLASWIRFARMWHRSYQQTAWQVLRGSAWTYGLRPLAGAWMHRLAPDAWQRRRRRRVMASDPPWLAPDAGLRRQQHERAGLNLAESDPAGGFYTREGRSFLDHSLMSWEFEEQFQITRPLGQRYLHPYWDVDLLSHVYRTPPEILNRGGRSKGQVRETIARRFPHLGFERQRKVTALGFFTGMLQQQAPALATGVLDFRGLASLGVVEPAGAATFVREALGGGQSPQTLSRAWNLINVETWVRHQVA